MRIGIDFDNTLAGYDRVFSNAARAYGYIPDTGMLSKFDVRARIRALDNGEEKWMALQGEVYGKRMQDAIMMPGADGFLHTCRIRGAGVVIVSHKTEYGHFDPDRVNLRDAARRWMTEKGFFDAGSFGLTEDAVYFESTRQEKVKRIAQLGCTHFIDDLVEVFDEPAFPEGVVRILYDPAGSTPDGGAFERHTNWKDIERAIFSN